MILEKTIETLYKKYKKRPQSADELDIVLLFENLLENHNIEIDDQAHLIINSLPADSPLHRIPLQNIHAIIEFESKIAIVLHSSIIFLNKHDSGVYIHIKPDKTSITDKIRRIFCRNT